MLNIKYKLLTDLSRNIESVINDGYHQAIMNIMHANWNESKTHMTYRQITDWFGDVYGDLAKFAVLIGKYNYQVCNGGHNQYYSNGYCDGDGSFYHNHDTTLPLHKELIRLLQNSNMSDENEIIKKAIAITKELEIELNDDLEVDNEWLLDDLDDMYYDINEEFMEILECYFKNQILNATFTNLYIVVEKNDDIAIAYIAIDDDGNTLAFDDINKAQEYADTECKDGVVIEITAPIVNLKEFHEIEKVKGMKLN